MLGTEAKVSFFFEKRAFYIMWFMGSLLFFLQSSRGIQALGHFGWEGSRSVSGNLSRFSIAKSKKE